MLKKTAHELDVRGLEDEKRVSELNVTVENLNMNVSMQHRTVIGLIEDHKEIIDRHTKEIEELKNKPEVVIPPMPDVKAGDGLDMN